MKGMYWVFGVAFGLFLATDRWIELIIAAIVTVLWCLIYDDRGSE